MASFDCVHSVAAMLSARVAESPDATAFFYEADRGWREITWRDFARRVDAIARGLLACGLVAGEHVGILAPTSLAWELCHHAILRAGGVVVGLEPHDLPERLQWIAEHAEIRLLVVQDDRLLGKLEPEQTAAYRKVVILDAATRRHPGGNVADLAQIESEGARIESMPLPAVAPAACATLIYTSGTTGQPKGILYRHEQVVLAVEAIARAYPSIAAGARFVCWLPLPNLFQRIMNLAGMRVGGTVFLVRNPLEVLNAVSVAQPDVFIGVPRFYEKLRDGMLERIENKPGPVSALVHWAIRIGDRAAAARRDGKRSSFLRRVEYALADTLVLRKLRAVMGGRIKFMVAGSAPTPMRILEFFDSIGLPICEAYGMSENVVPMALNTLTDRRLGTVGRALPQNELKLDADGELLVRGPGVFGGYYKDARGDLFTAEGYYRTGDYASIDADGHVRLEGRKSEIIKTSTGRRISPVAVETKLDTLAGVDRVVVLGSGRKCLFAMLTLAAERRPSASSPPEGDTSTPGMSIPSGHDAAALDALVKQAGELADTLPEHERPGGYLVLRRPLSIEAGELTPNLKIRRTAIEAKYRLRIDELFDLIDRRQASDPPPALVIG